MGSNQAEALTVHELITDSRQVESLMQEIVKLRMDFYKLLEALPMATTVSEVAIIAGALLNDLQGLA